MYNGSLSLPWRRYLRFSSVRVLIVAVLLIGGWLGWIVRSTASNATPSRRS